MLILPALSADHTVQISGHVKGYHYVHEYFHNSISTAIFCIITQRVVVISYRHFGTTYQSDLQGLGGQPISKELPLLAML
jgi:hypothetical protein